MLDIHIVMSKFRYPSLVIYGKYVAQGFQLYVPRLKYTVSMSRYLSFIRSQIDNLKYIELEEVARISQLKHWRTFTSSNLQRFTFLPALNCKQEKAVSPRLAFCLKGIFNQSQIYDNFLRK